MENIKLTLETDYEKYGNSSGTQIDTLSMAVCGMTYEGIWLDSTEFVNQYEEYALNEYDYESDFIATLTKEQKDAFIKDKGAYQRELNAFIVDLKDRVLGYELSDTHPLTKAVQEARDRGEDDLRKEWLHGDYREAGILTKAERKFGIELSYDEETDTLTASVEDDQVEEWLEYTDTVATVEGVAAYLNDSIEQAAYEAKVRNDAMRAKNRESYETRKRIEAERAAREEEERIKKLQS